MHAVRPGYRHRTACVLCMCACVCMCHLSAYNDSTIYLLSDGFHGKPPGKQPTLCLFDLRVGSQVRRWLANYSSNHSKCFGIAHFGHTDQGWRCWAWKNTNNHSSANGFQLYRRVGGLGVSKRETERLSWRESRGGQKMGSLRARNDTWRILIFFCYESLTYFF